MAIRGEIKIKLIIDCFLMSMCKEWSNENSNDHAHVYLRSRSLTERTHKNN